MEAATLIGLILMAGCAYANNRIQIGEQQALPIATTEIHASFYSQMTGVPDNNEGVN